MLAKILVMLDGSGLRRMEGLATENRMADEEDHGQPQSTSLPDKDRDEVGLDQADRANQDLVRLVQDSNARDVRLELYKALFGAAAAVKGFGTKITSSLLSLPAYLQFLRSRMASRALLSKQVDMGASRHIFPTSGSCT